MDDDEKILQALAFDAWLSGAEIGQATGLQDPGTLYPILNRLERDGWIESRREESSTPRRRLYRKTEIIKGRIRA